MNMKMHPDGRPREYPWDSWRDGPHFSARYLSRMSRGDSATKELVKMLLADPKLPHLFPNEDYLRRYVVHVSKTAEERDRRLAAIRRVVHEDGEDVIAVGLAFNDMPQQRRHSRQGRRRRSC